MKTYTECEGVQNHPWSTGPGMISSRISQED